MKRATIGTGAVLAGFIACTSGTGGTASGSSALSGYLDRLVPAYCAWVAGCSGEGTGASSSCMTEALAEVAPYRTCAAAETFYDAHRAELDACLTNAAPACGNDDPGTFCPAIAGVESLGCKAGGASSSSGSSGTSGGGASCGSIAHGAYKCQGDFPAQCQNGAWVLNSCCSIKVGDPRKPAYAATCKSSGSGSVECSYAGVQCKKCTAGSPCETTCTKCTSSNQSSCCP